MGKAPRRLLRPFALAPLLVRDSLPRSLRQVHPLVAELEWTEEAYQPEAMPERSAGRAALVLGALL